MPDPPACEDPESGSLLSAARGTGAEPAHPAVFCCPRGSAALIAAPRPQRPLAAPSLHRASAQVVPFLPGGKAKRKRQAAPRFGPGPREVGRGTLREAPAPSPDPAGEVKKGAEQESIPCTRNSDHRSRASPLTCHLSLHLSCGQAEQTSQLRVVCPQAAGAVPWLCVQGGTGSFSQAEVRYTPWLFPVKRKIEK